MRELTPEQKAKMDEYADKWVKIGLSTQPANRAEAEAGVKKAYELAGLNPPKHIYWADSPMSAAMMYAALNEIKDGKLDEVKNFESESRPEPEISGLIKNLPHWYRKIPFSLTFWASFSIEQTIKDTKLDGVKVDINKEVDRFGYFPGHGEPFKKWHRSVYGSVFYIIPGEICKTMDKGSTDPKNEEINDTPTSVPVDRKINVVIPLWYKNPTFQDQVVNRDNLAQNIKKEIKADAVKEKTRDLKILSFVDTQPCWVMVTNHPFVGSVYGVKYNINVSLIEDTIKRGIDESVTNSTEPETETIRQRPSFDNKAFWTVLGVYHFDGGFEKTEYDIKDAITDEKLNITIDWNQVSDANGECFQGDKRFFLLSLRRWKHDIDTYYTGRPDIQNEIRTHVSQPDLATRAVMSLLQQMGGERVKKESTIPKDINISIEQRQNHLLYFVSNGLKPGWLLDYKKFSDIYQYRTGLENFIETAEIGNPQETIYKIRTEQGNEAWQLLMCETGYHYQFDLESIVNVLGGINNFLINVRKESTTEVNNVIDKDKYLCAIIVGFPINNDTIKIQNMARAMQEAIREDGLEFVEGEVDCDPQITVGNLICFPTDFLEQLWDNCRLDLQNALSRDAFLASVHESVDATPQCNVACKLGIPEYNEFIVHVLNTASTIWRQVRDETLEGVSLMPKDIDVDTVPQEDVADIFGRPEDFINYVGHVAYDFLRSVRNVTICNTITGDSDFNKLVNRATSYFCYGNMDAHWLGFYEFFHDILRYEKETERLQGLWEIAKNAGWFLPMQDICIVCERPVEINLDDQLRLHSESGPSIRYRDGWATYHEHGVTLPAWVVEKPELISVKSIQDEQNAEVRRVMIEKFTIERYIRESNAVAIDQSKFGILYRLGLESGRDLVYIEVVNSTPEPDGSYKHYFLRVPPEMRTAHEAVAWTFYMTPEEYYPDAES